MSSLTLKLISPILTLIGLSLLILSSISLDLFLTQLTWVILGSLVFIFFWRYDIRGILKNREAIFFLYLFTIALLLLTLFFAPSIRGVQGWLVLGPLRFQVAELAKLSLLLIFAYFFAKQHISIARPKTIITSFILFAVPAGLIIAQPDLGSALVLFGMWFGFLLLSGLRLKHLLIGIFLFIITVSLSWFFALAPYQKERIAGVIYPNQDPLGVNYNVIQSKIAIGSGGWLGKGFSQGTQVQLGFLPEAHNDFIFASLVEEWGLLGGSLALGSILLLCWQIISISLRDSNTNVERFLCLGAVVIILLHLFVNVGSATGLTPVIGLPFPFLSYGGSNLLINFIIISIINSVAVRS